MALSFFVWVHLSFLVICKIGGGKYMRDSMNFKDMAPSGFETQGIMDFFSASLYLFQERSFSKFLASFFGESHHAYEIIFFS